MYIKIYDTTYSAPRVIIFCVVGALLAAKFGGLGGFLFGWMAAVGFFHLTFVTDPILNSLPDKLDQARSWIRKLFTPSGEIAAPRQMFCDCLRVGAKGALIGAVCGTMGIAGASSVCFLAWIGHYLSSLDDQPET